MYILFRLALVITEVENSPTIEFAWPNIDVNIDTKIMGVHVFLHEGPQFLYFFIHAITWFSQTANRTKCSIKSHVLTPESLFVLLLVKSTPWLTLSLSSFKEKHCFDNCELLAGIACVFHSELLMSISIAQCYDKSWIISSHIIP